MANFIFTKIKANGIMEKKEKYYFIYKDFKRDMLHCSPKKVVISLITTHHKRKMFFVTMQIYKIIHCIFCFLWANHLLNIKLIWWLLWIPICIFIIMLLDHESLNAYVNRCGQNIIFRLITALWFVTVSLSGLFHSPW